MDFKWGVVQYSAFSYVYKRLMRISITTLVIGFRIIVTYVLIFGHSMSNLELKFLIIWTVIKFTALHGWGHFVNFIVEGFSQCLSAFPINTSSVRQMFGSEKRKERAKAIKVDIQNNDPGVTYWK